MADENKLIQKKLDIYDNADKLFLDQVGKTQNAVLKKVMSLLNGFDRKDGKLVMNDTALQLINQLQREIVNILQKSTYEDRVSQYLRNFDEIEKLNKQLIEEVNGIKLSKINLNPLKTQAIEDLTAQLNSPDSIKTNLATPIRQVVFNSVATGMGYDEARKIISDFIAGDPNKLGHLERWTGQIARDAITQYDGLVNDVIRKEYDLNAYRYVGSLVDDSRQQCVRWVGKGELLFDDLEKEIKWAENNGQGMNPNTTPETFARYRGGYNCRHMAIPFRKVVKED